MGSALKQGLSSTLVSFSWFCVVYRVRVVRLLFEGLALLLSVPLRSLSIYEYKLFSIEYMPSSLLILHRGLRRDMKEFSYTKHVPKLPCSTKPASTISNPSLLLKNKELRAENALLQQKIHKEEQLQRMYRQITPELSARRMGQLDYSQTVQIHLLMRVEQKERELVEKERELEAQSEGIREGAEAVSQMGITKQAALYSALLQQEQLQKCLSARQSALTLCNRRLASLQKSKQILARSLLHSQAELASVQREMQERRARLPKSIETSLRDSDTPVGKLKPKIIQDLEREVSAGERDCEALACGLQLAMDQYITKKIQLRTEIDSL